MFEIGDVAVGNFVCLWGFFWGRFSHQCPSFWLSKVFGEGNRWCSRTLISFCSCCQLLATRALFLVWFGGFPTILYYFIDKALRLCCSPGDMCLFSDGCER